MRLGFVGAAAVESKLHGGRCWRTAYPQGVRAEGFVQMSDSKKNRETSSSTIAGIVILGIFVLALVTAFFGNFLWAKEGFGSGAFGDSFGWITSAFTGMAFLLLAISVVLQRMELDEVKRDRKDAQNTNDELRREAEQKRIEDAFFQLLNIAIAQNQRISYTDAEAQEVLKQAHQSAHRYLLDGEPIQHLVLKRSIPLADLRPLHAAIVSLSKIALSETRSPERREFLKGILSGFSTQTVLERVCLVAIFDLVEAEETNLQAAEFMHAFVGSRTEESGRAADLYAIMLNIIELSKKRQNQTFR